MIILGTSAIDYEEGKEVIKICSEISSKYNITNENFNGFNILQQNISRVGAIDIGFYNEKFDKNFINNINQHAQENKPVIFLLGLDDINLNFLKDSFVVYIGHHGDAGANIADVVLPSPAFPEKTSTFVNMEGKVLQTTKCYNPLRDSKDEWKIFRELSNNFNNIMKFDNLNELRKEFVNQFSFLKELNVLPSFKNPFLVSSEIFKGKNIKLNIENFYMTDSISRASSTMANCTKEILNKNSVDKVA